MSAGRNSAPFVFLFSFPFMAISGVGKDPWQAQGAMVRLYLNSWFPFGWRVEPLGGGTWLEEEHCWDSGSEACSWASLLPSRLPHDGLDILKLGQDANLLSESYFLGASQR